MAALAARMSSTALLAKDVPVAGAADPELLLGPAADATAVFDASPGASMTPFAVFRFAIALWTTSEEESDGWW